LNSASIQASSEFSGRTDAVLDARLAMLLAIDAFILVIEKIGKRPCGRFLVPFLDDN